MESPLLFTAFILLVVHVVVSCLGIAYSANLKGCADPKDSSDGLKKGMLIGGWSVSAAVCAISAVLVFIGMRKCGSSEADEE